MVEGKVKLCIACLLGFSDADRNGIKPEDELEGKLGLDSMDRLELAMMLEERLDVELNDSKVAACKTVGDVVALVQQAAGVAA